MLVLDSPRDGDIHSLADYAELLCFCTADRICSRETIADQLKDIGGQPIRAEKLDDCFVHLSWREAAFGDDYPFRLEDDRVLFVKDDLTDRQRLYGLLLLCANLPYLKNTTGLTDCFERISLCVLAVIWPSKGEVRPFGKNETNYTGAKWERINTLASEIGGVGLCNESTFRAGDSGDGGIDLVGWYQLDPNEVRNNLSILAQCACSRSAWPNKQTEISHDRLSANFISPTHRWNQALFIPHCFRGSDGRWAVTGEIGQVVLIDRLRIITQLPAVLDWQQIQIPALFEDFLEYRLPLV